MQSTARFALLLLPGFLRVRLGNRIPAGHGFVFVMSHIYSQLLLYMASVHPPLSSIQIAALAIALFLL